MKSKALITLVLIVLCAFSNTVAQTRETWRSVRTNHLFVIGNTDAEKLRQVASWLEFFHSAFAHLVSHNVLDSSVPTTVVIFRDDASFLPFKPLYQGRPANISGFFQPGEDNNYIVISLDSGDRDPFSTAFHEYVHLHLRDNVPRAPLWLNEGLAELYGSVQFSGNDATLGAPLYGYLRLLREQELLPLNTLFSIGTDSPHYNEQEKSGIFYGESWALVHYLMLGEHGRQEQFRRFLQQLSGGESAAKAIQSSFGMSVSMLEEDLRAYVRRGNLTAQRLASGDAQNYTAYTAMQRSSLTDGEANYYLGDLLVRQGRYAEAKTYLSYSIRVTPDYAPARYLVALIDFITDDKSDEALQMAEKAHQLAPSNQNYSALLEHIRRKRADPAAARQAQEALKSAMTSAVQTGTVRTLGGDAGGVVIHDGHTIESSSSLPAVDEVLNKYVQAMGGAAALSAVTSRVIKGTVDIVGVSRGGTFETYLLAPNKALTIIQAHPMGTMKAGYNGRSGWLQTTNGVRTLKDTELTSTQRDADFYGALNLKNSYAKVTVLGKSKIGYRDVYVIELQPAKGTAEKLYLDAERYLPVRVNSTRMQEGVPLPVEIYFDDWREIDGVKVPLSMTQSFPKLTLTLTVKEVRSNIPLDARLFERPL